MGVVMREKAGNRVAIAPDGRTHSQNGSGRAQVILDEVNVGLLRALLADPRLAIAELARRVELSGPAVADRLHRLESAGVIAGCRLDVSPAALGRPLGAYVRIRPGPGQLGAIIELAKRTPQVVECHRVTGDENVLLKVQAADMDELTEVIDLFFALGQITTSIVQYSPVPPRSVPLPDAC
jgi:Lrp/AsnC family transcriptional regulator, leucine-responsive regulatory protein